MSGRGTPNMFGLVETANLNHRITCVINNSCTNIRHKAQSKGYAENIGEISTKWNCNTAGGDDAVSSIA
jgi:hypothetical protein